MIETNGNRESGKSVQAAYDDDIYTVFQIINKVTFFHFVQKLDVKM